MEWERELQNRTGFHTHTRKPRRSFSTSTPFTQSKKWGVPPPFGSSSVDDSGFGASLNTTTSFTDVTPGSGDVTNLSSRKVCVSPPSSPITGRHVTTCHSLSWRNSSSRRSSRRSIGYLSDNSHDGEENINSSNVSRKYRCSPGRRLNLDLDIYSDYDDSSVSEDGHKKVLHSSSTSCSSDHKLTDRFYEILAHFSPIVPDRLIGRKIGVEKVDIIQHLDARNISCVSTVMEYLSAEDLRSMCQVSRDWKAVVEKDSSANERRKTEFDLPENSMAEEDIIKWYGKGRTAPRIVRSTYPDGMPYTSIISWRDAQRLDTEGSALVFNRSKTITDQFQEVAASLKTEEKLQKCPRCQRPAKVLPVQDRGICQNEDCLYDYCVNCLYAFHKSKDCPSIDKKQAKNDSIGTKKSKRNLKRL